MKETAKMNCISAKEVAETLMPSFPDTDIDVLETVVKRYKDIDAWNKTPVMTKDSFNRLQDVIEEAGELTKRAEFDKLVNNTFAEKSVKNK